MEPEARLAPAVAERWRARLGDAPEALALGPERLWGLAVPLLESLERLLAGTPPARLPLLALNGPVGAGKSTLGTALAGLARRAGLRLAVASIDDLYLPWPQRRQVLAGNPFGVGRVPPGSHDIPLLMERLERWRDGKPLQLPRFDKRLAGGAGDRNGERSWEADALLLEGWLMGCRALGPERLAAVLGGGGRSSERREPGGPPCLSTAERAWLPRWDRELASYEVLWQACDALWVLRPLRWSLPLRWRLQAEARQRRAAGAAAALPAGDVERLVRASLCSLPPCLYQDPLLQRDPRGGLPVMGVTVLDGRRRPVAGDQSSPSPLSSAMG